MSSALVAPGMSVGQRPIPPVSCASDPPQDSLAAVGSHREATVEQWVTDLRNYAESALRPAEGRIEIEGAGKEIEILTDRWGVPHVYAKNLDDVLFAQGWLHATERMWGWDFMRRAAQGRLSELVSVAGLGIDKFFRTLGLGRTARRFARDAPAEDTKLAEPYVRGFAAGAASIPRPVEYQFLDSDPEVPQTLDDGVVDMVSIGLLMSFTLSTNWPFEIMRAELAAHLGPERARELTPFIGPETPLCVPYSPEFPSAAKALRDSAYGANHRRGAGSNNWVVSGAKTTTGAPILCNDPHLLVQMPAIWMEMHLSCPGLDVAGVTLPGIPGVIIGHNKRIAWGFTNTQADVEDLYVERLSEDGKTYDFKGKPSPVKVIREKIFVRGETTPITHEVRTTRHGPLITSWIAGGSSPEVIEGRITEAVALRWIHHDVPPNLHAAFRLNTAKNWKEFREAAGMWGSAGQNMVYADVDGNIGYQFTGTVPIRPKGEGAAPLPGWTGEHEWKGTIPFDDLPRTFNPERSFVATANHRMVDIDYPYYLTNDWEMGHRIRRITSLLTQKEKLSAQDMARIQFDTHSGIAADLVPIFTEAESVVTGGKASEALKQVQMWDLRLEPDSVGGAIFNMWFSHVCKALFIQKLGPQLYEEYYPRKAWTTNWAYDAVHDILANPQAFWVGGDGTDNVAARNRLLGAALESACEELGERLGHEVSDWRWGRLHQVHFRHVLANAIPPLDELLSSGPFEAGGGDDTINRGVVYPAEGFTDGAIASWRQILDAGDWDRSLGVITTGNSGNPASLHYRDQSTLWARGEYHPLPFSRAAVDAATASRLTIAPAKKKKATRPQQGD
jgi:penicillin G amidase